MPTTHEQHSLLLKATAKWLHLQQQHTHYVAELALADHHDLFLGSLCDYLKHRFDIKKMDKSYRSTVFNGRCKGSNTYKLPVTYYL